MFLIERGADLNNLNLKNYTPLAYDRKNIAR